ncbi:hypothetical protein C2845_PM09G04140 [Panicum miliaceum]|uniref:DUF3615 domain-containing protein n=1 Tax=Panicum miliaceum TaxID=4540 RepID=A0A3L6S0M6_PANMI|nr:hypothetical protein C2845_PM09G04140 [Panicum miliaceum]
MDSSATELGGCAEWAAPALKDLLPELSREEQLRLQNRGFSGRDRRKLKGRIRTEDSPPSFSMARRTEGERDAFLIRTVQHALCHYNARRKGGEFDVVKPLMEARVGFRGQVWFHLNFWARSRSTSKIKRFFAEVHYKPSSDPIRDPKPIPIVEICTIIEEPLSQYRRICAFCPASCDILHPKGCRKFVCGNDKDRIGQCLVRCGSMCLEQPFTCPTQREKGHNLLLLLVSAVTINPLEQSETPMKLPF